MTHLYHGSTTQNLKQLEPRKRYTPAGKIDYAAIYATPIPAYAAAHSFPWSSEEGIRLDVIQGIVDMTIPKALKDRLQVPISIYTVPSLCFEHTKEEETGHTWHTTQPVIILEEKKYESVGAALKELGANVEFI